jgi:hypothetical protein
VTVRSVTVDEMDTSFPFTGTACGFQFAAVPQLPDGPT